MFWQNLLINIYWYNILTNKFEFRGLNEKSKAPVRTEVKNNTVKYGGKINGNDCKLSVNY